MVIRGKDLDGSYTRESVQLRVAAITAYISNKADLCVEFSLRFSEDDNVLVH